jgi:hypothetical protein
MELETKWVRLPSADTFFKALLCSCLINYGLLSKLVTCPAEFWELTGRNVEMNPGSLSDFLCNSLKSLSAPFLT